MQWTTIETLTTTVDHNDIRLRSIEPDGGESNPQVNDSNRHRAGSLQARGRPEARPEITFLEDKSLVNYRAVAQAMRKDLYL